MNPPHRSSCGWYRYRSLSLNLLGFDITRYVHIYREAQIAYRPRTGVSASRLDAVRHAQQHLQGAKLSGSEQSGAFAKLHSDQTAMFVRKMLDQAVNTALTF